jgi:hypothetical protein
VPAPEREQEQEQEQVLAQALPELVQGRLEREPQRVQPPRERFQLLQLAFAVRNRRRERLPRVGGE